VVTGIRSSWITSASGYGVSFGLCLVSIFVALCRISSWRAGVAPPQASNAGFAELLALSNRLQLIDDCGIEAVGS